jgi:hypothetical protein
MITSNFSGNFGDSIKKWILVRIIAELNGYEYGFNPRFNYDYYGGKNQFDDLFDLDYGHIHNATYYETPEGITNIWEERVDHFITENDSYPFSDYQKDVFDIPDNTKLVIQSMLDCRYYEKYKSKIRKWLNPKKDVSENVLSWLLDNKITLDENRCTLSIRGGEFRGIKNLILRKKYWDDAMKLMLKRNPNMTFQIVTDDSQYCVQMFNGEIPVIHHSIAGDYIILNNSRNVILSNSGFAVWPVYLSDYDPYTIGPLYWARHNCSNGYWASSRVDTFGWNFMNREGEIINE